MMRKRALAAMLTAFSLSLGAGVTAEAATYTVINTNNTGSGSLRQAIEDANATPSVIDTISFNISGPGSYTINLSSVLPTITDTGLTLDGTTQSGANCGTSTNSNGGISDRILNIGINGPTGGTPSADTLSITASNVTVKGVAIVGGRDDILRLTGADGFTLLCSHIGVGKDGISAVSSGGRGVFVDNSDNVSIGDGTLAGLNVISANTEDGLYVLNSNAISVNRNFFGLAIDGTTERNNGGMGLELDATINAFVSGNVSSANTQSGFSVFSNTLSSSAVFVGNYAGTNAAGTSARANGQTGITLTGLGTTASIGDGTLIGTNIFAGNTFTGISINTGATATVRGNYIGVGANGTTPIGNGASGIFVQGTGIIGGANNGSGNIIANSATNGVTVTGTASIVGNFIVENADLGIDLLGATGVEANDSGDGDNGPNDLLNYPVITRFAGDGSTLAEYDVSYDLPANASGHRIDFYKNSSADASGHGEGEIHLGAITVGGGAGSGGGSFTANAPVTAGDIISATTTRIVSGTTYDKTSEFSANAVATSSADPLIVTSTADTNTIGTLRFAINHANANAGDDDISFNIAGAGPHVITLASVLPNINDAGITIDGTTQSGASCGNLWAGTPHTVMIEIDADGGEFDALPVSGDNVTLKGLAVHGVNMVSGNGKNAVEFYMSASNGALQCSYIGLHADGSDAGAGSAGLAGIFVQGDSITIGGSGIGDGNVIANADGAGVRTEDSATDLVIEGNFIGTDPTGLTALSLANGIRAASGTTTYRHIRKNIISGAASNGIRFDSVGSATGASGDIIIAGNHIGVDRTGNTALANGGSGIHFLAGSASGVTIGGTSENDRNIISSNTNNGVDIEDVSGINILGNYIGVGADGVTEVGNGVNGINANGVTTLTIGNGTASGRNIISGHGDDGIKLSGTIDGVVIDGNYIGLGADGDTARGNAQYGISLDTATSDSDIIRGNVISGNGIGIHSINGSVSNLLLTGNYVGTDASGLLPRGNSFSAMVIDDGANGWIVGTPASGNIFAATPDSGAGIESYAGAHTFQNNKIGVGVDGTTALGNEGWGLRLYGGPHVVGGIGANEGNIIANSGVNDSFANVIVQGSGSATVSGNIIRGGLGYAGLDLSNAGTVVTFHDNTVTNNLGAGIQLNSDTQLYAYDNIISHNGDMGIRFGGATSQAAVYGNRIFGNAGLGIDFGGLGVTANDNGDSDAGANDLLNFPVLNSFTVDGTTSVDYDFNLDVPSNADGYRIDFYKNSVADPSGHGEGETHLGFVDILHAGGDLNFTGSFTANASVSFGDNISATTTRRTGMDSYDISSEFSLNYVAQSETTQLVANETVEVFDPSGSGLYAIPGNDVISSLTFTNTGNGTTKEDTIVIFKTIPAEMTFYNGDIDDAGPETNPVSFAQTAGAGLSFDYASDIKYSNVVDPPPSFNDCNYAPAAGYDANVKYVCINPKGGMMPGDPDPTAIISYRARIN